MFYCLGGANIDIYCKSKNKIIMNDSNPSDISIVTGGVARNMAVNLAALKEDICFVTVFGKDDFAKQIMKDLEKRGIDLSNSIRSKKYNTPVFVAILEKEDMFVGASDLSVLSEIGKKEIDNISKIIKDDDYLFFDTNLSKELIAYLLKTIKCIKVCDAISANKVVKLDGLTNNIDLLKLNMLEARSLAKSDLNSDDEIFVFINKLINSGTKEVLLSFETGVYLGNKEGIFKYNHNAYNHNPVNVKGAGDALISSYVHFRNIKKQQDESIALAIASAILTTYNEEVNIVNSIQEIESKYKELLVTKERIGEEK